MTDLPADFLEYGSNALSSKCRCLYDVLPGDSGARRGMYSVFEIGRLRPRAAVRQGGTGFHRPPIRIADRVGYDQRVSRVLVKERR